MKTEWNLEVLYKGLDDPAYEADMKAFEEAVKSSAEVIEKAKSLGDVEKVEALLLQEEKGGTVKVHVIRDFLGGPVAKKPLAPNAGCPGSVPGQGARHRMPQQRFYVVQLRPGTAEI